MARVLDDLVSCERTVLLNAGQFVSDFSSKAAPEHLLCLCHCTNDVRNVYDFALLSKFREHFLVNHVIYLHYAVHFPLIKECH